MACWVGIGNVAQAEYICIAKFLLRAGNGRTLSSGGRVPRGSVFATIHKEPLLSPHSGRQPEKLQSVPVGKSLLSSIQNAKPTSRGDFPLGINVMCVPSAMMFTRSGFVSRPQSIDRGFKVASRAKFEMRTRLPRNDHTRFETGIA